MISRVERELGIIKDVQFYKQNMYIIVFFCFIGLLSLNYYTYYQDEQRQQEHHLSKQSNQAKSALHYISSYIDDSFSHAQNSVLLLSQDPLLKAYLLQQDSHTQQLLENKWQLLLESSTKYTRLRILDLSGNEKIHVSYSLDTKQSQVIQQLQNKQNSNYFIEGKRLKKGQVEIIAFDTEVEFGQRVKSEKMAGRVITPLYVAGEKKGYVLLNLDMSQLITKVQGQQALSQQMISIVNHQGKPIYTPNSALKNQWLLLKNNRLGKFNKPQGELVEFGKYVNYSWLEFTGDHKSPYDKHDRLLLISMSDTHKKTQSNFQHFIFSSYFDLTKLSLLILSSIFIGWLINFLLQKNRLKRSIYQALSKMSATVLINNKFEIIGVSDEFQRLTGFSAKDLNGVLANNFFQEHNLPQQRIDNGQVDGWQGEAIIVCNNDTQKSVGLDICAIKSTNSPQIHSKYFVINIIDFTDRKKKELRLTTYAYMDELTGLHNRRYFNEQLNHAQNMAKRHPNSSYCLAIIDIDYFKRINDDLGHDVGDEVLQKFALCLPVALREIDHCYRVGGEEFAIILPFTDLADSITVLDRLRKHIKISLSNPQITCSIGISHLAPNKTSKEVFKEADLALYEAKAAGRDNVKVYCEQTVLENPNTLVTTSL